MNLFNMDVTKKCLIGECWVPIADLGVVQNCLTEGSVSLHYYFAFKCTIVGIRKKFMRMYLIFVISACAEVQFLHF